MNLPRLYQREANHIIAAVERLIVLIRLTYWSIEFYWEVCF